MFTKEPVTGGDYVYHQWDLVEANKHNEQEQWGAWDRVKKPQDKNTPQPFSEAQVLAALGNNNKFAVVKATASEDDKIDASRDVSEDVKIDTLNALKVLYDGAECAKDRKFRGPEEVVPNCGLFNMRTLAEIKKEIVDYRKAKVAWGNHKHQFFTAVKDEKPPVAAVGAV